MTEKNKPPLLEVKNLKKYFPVTKGFFKRSIGSIRAVDGINFELREGECLGLVGESGSGKTTLGRTILRALTPTEGDIFFYVNEQRVNLAQVSPTTLRTLRRHMQMIFQDPYASLNPRMTVLDIIGEPLRVHGVKRHREREDRVRELMVQVGLRPQHLRRYPHAFSGGQRQRIGIGRALALHPKLIVADEPVSALDVSIQAQILNLLTDLQDQLKLTYLFIAHDLNVVRYVANRIAVMYMGKIVELAEVENLFKRPLHPYTEALLSAIPVPKPGIRSGRILLPSEVVGPDSPREGCAFYPRCRYRADPCRKEVPELRELFPTQGVRCHRAEKLALVGKE